MGLDQRRSHATSLAAVLPIAVAGAIGYSASDYVDWNAAAALLVGSIFGALYGVKLLGKVSLKFLQLGFAGLLLLVFLFKLTLVIERNSVSTVKTCRI
jgi:uncharacterized membrane protein YfcA